MSKATSTVPTPDHNAQAKRCNPIIGEDREETLFNAGCVAQFLAGVHLSNAQFAQEIAGESMSFSPNELRGASIVCEVLAAAIWYELEGRQ